MIYKIIFSSLIATSTGLALNWANKQARLKGQTTSAGIFHLKMSKIYFFGGISSLFIWMLFSVYIFCFTNENIVTLLLAFGLISFISLIPGTFCLFLYLNHEIVYDQEKVYVRNIYKKEKEILFKDVIKTNQNFMTGLFSVNTKLENVKIHAHLIGSHQLIKKLKDLK